MTIVVPMKYPLILTLLFYQPQKKGDKQPLSAYLLSTFCRDDQTRTGDLAPPRRVRYQLRYIPILLKKGVQR